MNFRFNIIIGILFILVGGLIGSDYIINYVRELHTHASSAPQIVLPAVSDKAQQQSTRDIALPTNVAIPSLDISVSVDPGYYDTTTQTWTLSDTKAFFATISTPPNSTGGNTYIYGHNRGNIFNPVNTAELGTAAVITTSDKKSFTYTLSAVHDVSPEDSSWLVHYKGKPILTLQTCAGFWDQYRRLFIFDFVSET